ncbi:MAG: phosphoribosylformylglycinamidine synthase subunit PurS [Candidatus Bathyarchaeota archaeon]|nr:phosphoribosylformylglycinamidine synthase subunit PurS [Candidatus Bathyarchaeota archaeon]MDH5732537.1 phosphoribosylformylglycinamidine synthase subunit PurS [Candidatus Bathyarchaeota archaeon]
MEYQVKVEVSLKPGHSDPEGETTAKSLQDLRYPVETVKVGKVYTFTLSADSLEKAKKQVDEICQRLLANPVKDNYDSVVEEKSDRVSL